MKEAACGPPFSLAQPRLTRIHVELIRRMKASQRAQSISPFFAMEIGKQAAALEAQGHRVIKLNIGEPDFGAPPAVIRAMRDLMDGRPMPYTAALGLPELRQAIAGFYRQMHGVDLPASRVVVTAGASAALLLSSRSRARL